MYFDFDFNNVLAWASHSYLGYSRFDCLYIGQIQKQARTETDKRSLQALLETFPYDYLNESKTQMKICFDDVINVSPVYYQWGYQFLPIIDAPRFVRVPRVFAHVVKSEKNESHWKWELTQWVSRIWASLTWLRFITYRLKLIFTTAPAAVRNKACYKSGQNWLKKSHLASWI